MNETNQKSYVQYTSLFNKVCSSPLFLVLAGLISAYTVASAIYFFGAMGNVISMFIPGLNLIFSIVSTIAIWLIFAGAKKGNINPKLFKLAAWCGKYVRVVANALSGAVAFLTFIVAALVYTLKDTLAEMLVGIADTISEMGESLDADVSEVSDYFADLAISLEEDALFILIGCVVIFLLCIISMVRFSMAFRFVKSIHKTYTTGHMVAAPTMTTPVFFFIFAAIGLYLSVPSFDLTGICYSLIIAMFGVLILLNKNELARIYGAWQKEIGMVTADAAAPAAAPAAPAAEETPAE